MRYPFHYGGRTLAATIGLEEPALPIFWMELIAGVLYVLLGPGAWVALGFAMSKGRKRMRLLSRPAPALGEPAPRVTMLIPAKDEAQRIERCLEAALRQDYPNLELVLIDDRSDDGTAAILDAVAARDPRAQVVHVAPHELPAGWGGKSHALHRGAQKAAGSWLLFVDADVRLEPDALRAALAEARRRNLDLISLLPRFRAEGFWERLLQPLAGAATSVMFAIPLTNANASRVAFANGQFMLVRRAAYEHSGGHEAIRGTLSEDTALARRLKALGYRPRLAWGDEFASVRMYDSLGEIIRGWGRNFFAGSRGRPWRLLAAGGFLVVCCLSVWGAVAWGVYRQMRPLIWIGGWGWLTAALVHGLLMTALVGTIYAWSRISRGYALLFPLGACVLLGILARSLILCLTGRVEWRGTRYTRAGLNASTLTGAAQADTAPPPPECT